MNILVTGGNGLTGRYIVDRLSREHHIEVLDHRILTRVAVPSHRGDVLDLDLLKDLTRGIDAVVHLAAIPHPLEHRPEEVFRTNVVGTFNVLEASSQNGIGRVVFMSSESVLGFAFSNGAITPEYLPVDESHPLRPVDPYGLSKSIGESLCASYARRGGMTTLCLRPPWIWVPEEGELQRYRDLLEKPDAWPQTLWAYIHVLDVAEAVARALVQPYPAGFHGVCFVGANTNWTGVDSNALARRFYPQARLVEPTRSGPYSLLSLQRAEELIGFRAQYTLHDLPGLLQS